MRSPLKLGIFLFFSIWQISAASSSCKSAISSARKEPISISKLKGLSLLTTDPFGHFPEEQFKVIVVDSLPKKANKNAKWPILQDQVAVELLNDLINRQIPVVIGELPLVEQRQAFVSTLDYQITHDVLAAKKDTRHKHILFIQPNTSADVIKHEIQHFEDYELNGFFDSFSKDLLQLGKKLKLKNEDLITLQDAVVEQRGHAAQEKFVNQINGEKNGGKFITVDYQPYADSLILIIEKLKRKSPGQYQALLEFLLKHELKPGSGLLQFKSLLPQYFQKSKP